MNPRILELAEQAQQYAEYSTPQGLEWFYTFKEKFAELIVRECAKIANKAENTETEIRCMYDVITEHFGVTE